MARKLKKGSSAWYRKKCVERGKKIAKERDGYKCVLCGISRDNGGIIHASHIFPEGKHRSMSHLPENMLAMCYWHHIEWWHKHPTESGKWFAETYPDTLKKLRARSNELIKTDWKKEWEDGAKELTTSS